jgi:hypothetical protein
MKINRVAQAGLWLTVIAAAIWVGDHAIRAVVDYTPLAIGVGILLMAIGLVMEARKPAEARDAGDAK